MKNAKRAQPCALVLYLLLHQGGGFQSKEFGFAFCVLKKLKKLEIVVCNNRKIEFWMSDEKAVWVQWQ